MSRRGVSVRSGRSGASNGRSKTIASNRRGLDRISYSVGRSTTKIVNEGDHELPRSGRTLPPGSGSASLAFVSPCGYRRTTSPDWVQGSLTVALRGVGFPAWLEGIPGPQTRIVKGLSSARFFLLLSSTCLGIDAQVHLL